MNHTPDKWVLDEDGEPFIYQLNGAGTNLFSFNVQGGNVDTGERTSKEHRRSIAAFIHRACNAHKELLEALKNLLYEPMAERTVDAAKRAIAKAEGKEA